MLPNLAQGFLESGTCFDLPLSRKQGRLAIFLDRREVAVLVRWGAFVVGGGVAAMVLVVVMVGVVGGEEVGIRGCGHWFPHCLTECCCCCVLVMQRDGHARMGLVPIHQVVLEGGLWGA